MTTLKKIQTGLWTSHPRSWATHVKNESLDGAAQTQLILGAPVIINDTCQLPGFVVNLYCASYEDVLCMNVDQHDVN